MHPDFLFFHQDGDGVVMDIVDPHRHDLRRRGAEVGGAGRYAQDHADRVRRVLAVIRTTGGELRALDLTAPGIEDAVAVATGKDHLEALFASAGVAY